MRKVTKIVCSAFVNRQPKAMGNTTTDGQSLFLHGNMIARWINGSDLEVTNAGWPTTTTRERLNGLPNVSVHQAKGVQYLNGAERDGSWKRV